MQLNTTTVLEPGAGCEDFIRSMSLQLLGSFPTCDMQGSKLYIYPSQDATVAPGAVLQLTKGQTALNDAATGVPLTGRVTVANCSGCLPPTAVVSGPSVVYNPCEDAAGSSAVVATFDGTQSTGSSRRALLKAMWSLARGSGNAAALLQAINAANSQQDIRCAAAAAARPLRPRPP